MKIYKTILGISLLLISTGCIAKPYPSVSQNSCPELSQAFNYHMYVPMDCLVTNKNIEDDKEACISSELERFRVQFTEYLQPFYNAGGENDELRKIGRKINNTSIPRVDLPYSSNFCRNLAIDTDRAFQNKISTVSSLNKAYHKRMNGFKSNLKLNPIVKLLPRECFGVLDSLLEYQMDSNNKKDDYYWGFRREYIECIHMYTKEKGVTQ
ncbi:MAG TPA: hypothetical protein EYG73_00495 [Arcobacter sp.]|nr:hypothetical protein [Arcobacter sp.]